MSKPTLKKRTPFLVAVLTLMLFTLTGCSSISGFGFEPGLSSINDISLSLWQGAWIAAAIVGAITLVLILWPAIFHRKKVGAPEFPKQTQYNVPIEIIYTVIPLIIIAVMFYFTVIKQSEIQKSEPAAVMHEIGVKGIQWAWQFSYPAAGENAVVTGTPAQPAILVIPLGERVRYTLTSNDVVHGFWIPAFMIQLQNLPGVTNYLEFTAKKLGSFPGRCNILCGRAHTQMIFTVKVVTPAEYKSYLETLKAGNA